MNVATPTRNDAKMHTEANDPFDIAPLRLRAIETPTLPADIERYIETQRLEELERAGLGAPATLRAYRSDWKVFKAWCAREHHTPLPAQPVTIARYIRYLADRQKTIKVDKLTNPKGQIFDRRRHQGPCSMTTIDRHLISIRLAHRNNNHDDPTTHAAVKRVRRGLRKERGIKRNQKEALDLDALRLALAASDHRHDNAIEIAQSTDQHQDVIESHMLQQIRNRAMLLLGWSGALRRSEIVGIYLEDITISTNGAEIQLRRSKTNQHGEHEHVLIHRAQRETELCPVYALQLWSAQLAQRQIRDGRLFRRIDRHGNIGSSISAQIVARLIKTSAAAANLDPKRFGGHSLRAGWITSSVRSGADEATMMLHSRHKSIPVFRSYVREADKWRARDTLRIL